MASRMLTVREVCEYLHVSRATVYRLLRRRDIPAFRVAIREWRFKAQDLADWIETRSRAG
jgi:excisionase family DNA binding protein